MKQPRSIYVWSLQLHRLKGLPCNCVFLRREISHRPPQRKFQIRQFYVHEVLKSADVSNLLICHIFSHTALRTWRSFILETDSRLNVMVRFHWATATTITLRINLWLQPILECLAWCRKKSLAINWSDTASDVADMSLALNGNRPLRDSFFLHFYLHYVCIIIWIRRLEYGND